jgi:NADH dehydrogenase
MKNLVVGSTGVVGLEICRLLASQGETIRALVRRSSRQDRVDSLRALGVELVTGDLTDPPSLAVACSGVDVVFSTATAITSQQPGDSLARVDQDGQKALVDAARAAGVKRFVFISALNMQGGYPLADAKQAVEAHLGASGLEYTILQPSCFMDVWLTPMIGFDYPNGKAAIYGDGSKPLAWIHSSDVARVAVAAGRDESCRNATVPFGGPERLAPNDVIAVFEEASGRRFDVQYVPVDALQAQQSAATDPVQRSFAGLMLRCAAGDPATPPLPPGLAFATTSVRDYAARAVRRS